MAHGTWQDAAKIFLTDWNNCKNEELNMVSLTSILMIQGQIKEYNEKIEHLRIFLREYAEEKSDYDSTVSKEMILTSIFEKMVKTTGDASFGKLEDLYNSKTKDKKTEKEKLYEEIKDFAQQFSDKYTEAQMMIAEYRNKVLELEELLARMQTMP